MIEKLNYQDKRLIFICVIISVVSFFITQNYYREAFPYASIDMDVTQDDAKILAEKLLINKGYNIQDYKQASKFGHLDREKLFLEYHLSREEAGEILNETNSYYWQNRWFIPEQKEEFKVNISTTGKLAEYEHKIDENAPGDALSKENALQVAQLFLSGAVDSWDMENWKLENSNITIQKNRIDHQFEWVEKSFDNNGSTHRITIRVQGSVVDYYNEWIKVPDTWDHDYKKMKSNNEILDNVSFGLTFLIISYLFISILIRSQKKDLRWKTAFIYSGVLAFLLLINRINNIPLEFYSFDTKETLISFFTGEFLMGVLLGPVFMFFFIGMLIAGAEPFYRDQFPKQISFRHILTIQGIKGRSFFNSAIIGISLTFAWFAFGTIFRIMENKMGGITTTEVPEFDMLSTFIPFVGVLLIGLRRAMVYETIFRMFLIPFLQKYAKSTVLAVIISSIIWGLTHASHGIHQPFYMHIIEISIWGCIIGWIFLKYGILTTLIWHFSIQAVPSAMILLQSSNPYYITTGFVSAGLIFIPLIYAVISYRRNGGFILSNNLVNALDTEIYEEKIEAREEIKKAAISTTYKPLSRNRVIVGIIIGFIGIFSFIAVTMNDPLSNLKRLDKSSAEAVIIAEDYLLRRGFDLENYRFGYEIENVFYHEENNIYDDDGFFLNIISPNNKFFGYIKETSGKAALRSYLSNSNNRINDWVIRFFKPETKREYKVWVSAKGQDNGVIYFEETLADTTYIPSLSKENAQDLVNQFAQQNDMDIVNMDIVDNSKTDKGSRIDHFFKYKANNHQNNIAEAETYYEFEVYGNHIGKFKTGIELPEVWLREFDKGQSYEIIYVFITLSLIIILFILAVRYLLKLLKDNKPNWKFALIISALVFSGQIIAIIDHFPHLLFQQYDTSEALNSFLLFQIIITIVTVGFITTALLIPVLLVNLGWPGFNNTFKKYNRAKYLKDAFVCLFCSIGLYYLYTCIEHLLSIYHSTYFPYNFQVDFIGSFWFLTLFLDTFTWNTVYYYFYITGIFYVYRQFTANGGFRKLFFIIVFSLPIIMPYNNLEPILFILNIIWFGLFIVLFRYFCRGNTWGYLFGIMGYFIIPGMLEYFQTIQVPEYRYHLIAAILCMGLFFLYFLREAFFNPKIADQ